jgi:hypothetical protein
MSPISLGSFGDIPVYESPFIAQPGEFYVIGDISDPHGCSIVVHTRPRQRVEIEARVVNLPGGYPDAVLFWRQIVERITYKPNVKLKVYNPRDTPMLCIEMRVHDTFHPDSEELVKIGHQFALPCQRIPEEAAINIIRGLVHRAEHDGAHESDEWLRVDGEMRWNPHNGRRIPL